jgi:hypothetical protein
MAVQHGVSSRHTSVIGSPSSRRATKRRRSSIAELSYHGIHTSRPQKAKKKGSSLIKTHHEHRYLHRPDRWDENP